MFDFMDGIYESLKKFFNPIVKFFAKRLFWFITPIVAIVQFLIKMLTGGGAILLLVWHYVSAYFIVVLIKRFILYPVLVAIVLYLMNYLYVSYVFSFLDSKSIESYITDVINNHDYLINASVILYQIGLLQALTIYFYFILVTFILRFFIDFIKRD